MALCADVVAAEIKGVTFDLGSFVVEGEYATQAVTVTNATKRKLKYVEIECGFFSGRSIVTSASAFVENFDPGEQGFGEVLADDASESTSAKCRVVSAE